MSVAKAVKVMLDVLHVMNKNQICFDLVFPDMARVSFHCHTVYNVFCSTIFTVVGGKNKNILFIISTKP